MTHIRALGKAGFSLNTGPEDRTTGRLGAKLMSWSRAARKCRDESDACPVDRLPQQPGTRCPHASHTADVISQTRRTASRIRSGHLRSTRFRGPEHGQRGPWPASGPS